MSYLDTLYETVFDREFSGLQKRRETDVSLTLGDLKNQLQHLYISEGDDWLGRGEVGSTTMAATIAAFEAFCASWEKE
jgi:hypothetical protein